MRKLTPVLAMLLFSGGHSAQAIAASPIANPGDIGLVMWPVDDASADRLGLPRSKGELVERVQPQAAADRAGIRPSDVIVQLNGLEVGPTSTVASLTSEIPAGTKVIVRLLRAGTYKNVAVMLGSPVHDEGLEQQSDTVPYHEMRIDAENALRSKLVDPLSAVFRWNHGFYFGEWKPLLQKRVTGWIACGYINARNRMGGFAGENRFIVVVNDGQVLYSDMDSGTGVGLVGAVCEKNASAFPPPQVGMLDDTPASSANSSANFSVADELTKLARLRDDGVLSQAEFDTQKAVLLNRQR